MNSAKLIKSIKDKVEIEVFLTDDIKTDEIAALKEKIRTIGGIKSISYISKDSAAKIFESQFGKEMLDIYDVNPLPPSLKINLYDEYKTTERMNKIKTQMSGFPNAQDIIFPEKNLELIEKNTSGFTAINLIIMLTISISSVFLVSNTIRLIINSKKKIIETFKLLGATRLFIMSPFLIEGFIQGLAGSAISIGILWIIYGFYSSRFSENELKLEFISGEYMLYLTAAGILLGVAGSFFSVNKYLKFQSQ